MSPIDCGRPRHGLPSSSSSDFSLPLLHTKFGECAFTYTGPSAWNSLPKDLRAVTDPGLFRNDSRLTFIVWLSEFAENMDDSVVHMTCISEISHLNSLGDFWRHFGLCWAAAHSDCCFLAPGTNILTYLLIVVIGALWILDPPLLLLQLNTADDNAVPWLRDVEMKALVTWIKQRASVLHCSCRCPCHWSTCHRLSQLSVTRRPSGERCSVPASPPSPGSIFSQCTQTGKKSAESWHAVWEPIKSPAELVTRIK